MVAPTIKQALEQAAKKQLTEDTDFLQVRSHELVAHTLYEIANRNAKTPKEQNLAIRAQRMLFDRLVGRRKPGSKPLVKKQDSGIDFLDLTVKEISL